VIRDAREHVGKPGLEMALLSLAVWINLNTRAARSPPRSEPANS
jgi:hypothetical protein